MAAAAAAHRNCDGAQKTANFSVQPEDNRRWRSRRFEEVFEDEDEDEDEPYLQRTTPCHHTEKLKIEKRLLLGKKKNFHNNILSTC